MARFEITSPDGKRFEVNAPDGASQDQVMAYAKAQWNATPRERPINPTDDMSTFERGAAGVGKAVVDTGRGIRQLGAMVGIGDSNAIQREIDEAKKTDAPLMDTGAGMAGNVLGNIGMALAPGGGVSAAATAMQRLNMLRQYAPLLMKAGGALALPNSVTGAATMGAIQGGVQPVASDESRAGNVAWGAGGGAAGIAGGRVLDAGARGAQALVQPFTQGGREDILARTLNRFAGDPEAAAAALKNAPEYVPGSRPTVGEASGDAGLAGLQLAAASNDPKIKAALLDRARQQNAARLSTLGDVAGEPGKKSFYEASRDTAANDLYGKAFAEVPGDTQWIKGEVTKLMKRPAFVDALGDGQRMMANLGRPVRPDAPELATETLHYTKLALDDAIDKATKQDRGNEVRALIGTRDKLVEMMESKNFSPTYREARKTYAEMSKPINEMEVGEDLKKKFTPALMDVAGIENPTRVNSNEFARSVRERGQDLDTLLSPEAKGKVMGVANDLARKAVMEDSAKTVGSTTTQNLAGQNLMRQITGPLGLPQSWGESTLALTAARPLNWAYKIPETKIQDELAQLLLDSGRAGRLMDRARTSGLNPQQLQQREALARIISAIPGVGLGAGVQSRE